MFPRHRMIPQPSPAVSKRGFTLIELLVVIAILGIVAAVAWPSISRMITSGQRAKCASNLRQVGVALQSYLGENNMIFPTSWVSLPCNPEVNVATVSGFRPLSAHLARYLRNESPSDKGIYLPALHCPAWPVKVEPHQLVASPPVWFSTYRLVLGLPGRPNPFGGQSGRPKFSALNIERDFGMTTTKFPVIFNMDQGLPLVSGTDSAPEEPVFVTGRNVLYLDGHVGFETDLDFLADRFR